MLKKIFILSFLFIAFFSANTHTYAARSCLSLNSSDSGTFKEYCYKITDSFLDLRNRFEVDGEIDTYVTSRILNYAKTGLLYLPNDLKNKNYFTSLKIALEKGAKYPKDSSVFDQIESSISDFLNKTSIQEVSGTINVFPKSGNAPLTVTLRGDVDDPTGTNLESYNYTWWVLDKGRKKVIGNRVYLQHTFREEGNYSVFLDVTSNHRNKNGNTDVLSFSRKAKVEVKEKIASTILRINGKRLGGKGEMKFSPQESAYGLLIDATSSTPTSGTKFVETEWDFGNGVEKKYDGAPKVERVVYPNEGTYEVVLKMKTNTGRSVERKFDLVIRNPIATIESPKAEGFLGEEFKFSANPTYRDDNLTFSWEIVDLSTDKVVFTDVASLFSYSFTKKGRYNVKLQVTSPSGERDYDNKIIYINSRAPVANFTSTIPNTNKPNTVFLDGSMSYDMDFSDDGRLRYSWIIDGDRVELDDPNAEGSNGYYTFASLGDHSVVLEVIDPDDIISQKKQKVKVTSLLSVDFSIFPRVTQVGKIVRFIGESPNATFFEWNFGDGSSSLGTKDGNVTHKFEESGTYKVKLQVKDKDGKQNTLTKEMYVADANKPYAHISFTSSGKNVMKLEKDACNGEDAYIGDRISNITLSGEESVDVSGKNTGLKYSWKVGNDYYDTKTLSKRFDEAGCFKVKLTVRSKKTGGTSTKEVYIKIKNIKPTLSSLDLSVKDSQADPVIVDVKAVGAQDPDGVIQSYLWYYYTDTSPEPQGFRSTKKDKTTFVLPKVTGTYYFVAILKDNNEERINSEEIASRYFITLAGDNINTPILSLKVDNSSISVGQEVTFTVNAENIMTKNINKESRFYWDFDGDGFYDKETASNVVTHKFTRSGEMRAKVKVSHKGFSNTRTAVINVSNILKPDFSYVSIGDKYVFFNETTGSISKYYWSMGDGSVLNKGDSFVYNYDDKKSTHIVKLRVEDGAKTKETSKKVTKNLPNLISIRRNKINIFSNHAIKDDTVTLNEEKDNLYLYIDSVDVKAKSFAIDYDISLDSDLNGGNDDDRDNKDEASFYSGGPIKVKLNPFQEQTFRVFLLAEDGGILANKDIKIIKKYIEDEPIDPDSITFEGIPNSIKEKFEKIKQEVSNFPKEHREKGFEYVQRLKEEWNDDRAKTNIILEFEGFIKDSEIENSKPLIDALGTLLTKTPNADERFVQLQALKNLIPKDIGCSEELQSEIKEGESCATLLHKKLEAIFESSSVDDSKILGNQVWGVVRNTSKMKKKEKADFGAIMKTLVYVSIDDIPDDSKGGGNIGGSIDDSKTEGSGFFSGLLGMLSVLFYIILGVGVLIGLFFFGYKIFNRDKEKSFTDFVSEKTSEDEVVDILGGKSSTTEESNYDPLADFDSPKDENEKKESNDFYTEDFQNIDTPKETGKESAPDWLQVDEPKESVDSIEKEDTTLHESQETRGEEPLSKKDEELVINSGVPDWLKGSIDEESSNETIDDGVNTDNTKESSEDVKKEIVEEKEEVIVEGNPSPDEDIPDWLKGNESKEDIQESQEDKKEKKEEKTEKIEKKEEVLKEPKLETKEELDSFTKLEEDTDSQNTDENIPDWLKDSFDEKEEETSEKEVKDKPKNEKAPKEEKKVESIPPSKQKENKKTNKKVKTEKIEKTEKQTPVKKTATPKKRTSTKKTAKKEFSDFDFKNDEESTKGNSSKDNSKKDELWDDGMKVPDWLKTDE